MIKLEPMLFNRLTKSAARTQTITNTKNIGLTQKEILLETIAKNNNISNQDFSKALDEMFIEMAKGNFAKGIEIIKKFTPNQAAIIDTKLGTAVMAEGWSKPIVFPKEKGFKMLDWADKPSELTTEGLWTAAYGEKPALTMGAVGNSNIKPEQVAGGCSLTKQELSAKYEQGIQDFYNPIFAYLKDCGADTKDIGFAFAHSDTGVDRAARNIVEKNGLKGFATTPTRYTQYLRGKEMPPCEEFPNGFILADFPFPSVLTRNIGQIDDYASVYSKIVGKDMPLGVFGGGEHAFAKDAKEALIGPNGSQAVPVDIMKDKFGIVIPAVDEKGIVTNAARDMIEKVNGSPYEQYKYAFRHYLPENKHKSDLAQYDPQASIATIAYTQLAKAGKIGK